MPEMSDATTTTVLPSSTVALVEPVARVRDAINQWVMGLDDALVMMTLALICGGHVLLEGPPGTAKTMMVKLLGQALNLPFKRIQFTPDMMPADLIGTNIYNQQEHRFTFHQGPLFTTFLLADEINRAPAKTQSALLECMQEHQVTVEGEQMMLGELFTVFATQNPLEHEGTYPLPEAQLDRFLFKLVIPYPSRAAGLAILKQHHQQTAGSHDVCIEPVLGADDLIGLRQAANAVTVQEPVLTYLADLVDATRQNPHVAVGASPRSAILWLKAAKAMAYVEQRDYVIPDDIKRVGPPLLRHRLILFPQAELEGRTPDSVIDELFGVVKPPR